MKLLPRRMATQLGMLFLVALLASNVIAALWLQRTGTLVHPLSRAHSLAALSTAYAAAQQLNPNEAAALLAAIADDTETFWLTETPAVPTFDMREEEQRLAQELAERLRGITNAPVVMQLERVTGDHARSLVFTPAGWAPLRLRTSIGLPDGRWLNALQHPSGGYEWRRMLAYSLPVSTVPILLIVLFAGYRIVRPIKRLANATERFSLGERIPPLPVSGPLEAQELAQAFNVMQARIDRHVQGRTRMLAAISHDLNTPIMALRLQVELMAPSAERDDMLESLAELRYMVSETLAFVRGEAVNEPVCRLSLTELIDDLVRRYRSTGQTLTWSPNPASASDAVLLGRPIALKRALTNLIDNALRHGGDATITVHLDEPGFIRVEVLDHGPGLAPELLEQVFEPFVQVGAARASGELADAASPVGLGLGLAIARSAAQAHGGELVLENRPPAGLCAVMRLPRSLKN